MEAVGPCSLGNGGRVPTFLGVGETVKWGAVEAGTSFAYR